MLSRNIHCRANCDWISRPQIVRISCKWNHFEPIQNISW